MEIKRLDWRYLISKDGSYIRDKVTGEKLFPHLSQGYKVISLKINGINYYTIKMSHLNWIAHYGPVPKECAIHHIEWSKNKKKNAKLKLNDHIDNLQCMTNADHASLHLKGRLIENHPALKITNDEVKEIKLLKGKFTYREMADLFGVSRGHISNILNRRSRVED